MVSKSITGETPRAFKKRLGLKNYVSAADGYSIMQNGMRATILQKLKKWTDDNPAATEFDRNNYKNQVEKQSFAFSQFMELDRDSISEEEKLGRTKQKQLLAILAAP